MRSRLLEIKKKRYLYSGGDIWEIKFGVSKMMGSMRIVFAVVRSSSSFQLFA